MEEQNPSANDQKMPNQPPTGRFMDIQTTANGASEADKPAEQPGQVIITPDGQLSDAASEPTIPSEPTASPPPQPTVTDVPVAAAAPEADKPAEEPPTPNQPSAENQGQEQPSQPEHPATPPKSHHAPLIAVIVAIIVTLGLCGLVVYAYMKSKNNPTPAKTTNNTSQTPVAKPQASPEDVDQVSADIDQSLTSLDDAADFSANAISDQALGLQ